MGVSPDWVSIPFQSGGRGEALNKERAPSASLRWGHQAILLIKLAHLFLFFFNFFMNLFSRAGWALTQCVCGARRTTQCVLSSYYAGSGNGTQLEAGQT